MTYRFFSRSSLRLLARSAAAGAVLAVAVVPSAAGQTCSKSCGFSDCGTPASGVASQLWGELESAEGAGLLGRDSTHFQEFGHNHVENQFPWFTSVDVEESTVFTSTGYGVTAWERSSSGALGTVWKLSGRNDFPFMAGGELSNPLQDVDAPPGNAGAVAVSGLGTFGLAIIDAREVARPRVAYQDQGEDANEVYAARIGGRDYAFLATASGVRAYDMTAALALSQKPCLEDSRTATHCAGVAKGLFGRSGARFLDGTGNFLVASFGSGRGVEIWDVSNPASPVLKLSALNGQNGIPVDGVALWSAGGKHYLALATSFFQNGNVYEGRTYDVSCITGSCGSIGGPLDAVRLGQPSGRSFVTYSKAGARSFLYFGNDNRCVGGKREVLADASNPANLIEVSPPGYWESISHFNRSQSGRAKFDGEILYRAGLSVFDMHRLAGGSPPAAAFTFPDPVYSGVPATFVDDSAGLVETRTWSFQDGTPSGSTLAAVAVTFASAGTKQVSLEVGNAAGFDTAIENVQVLDPKPAVAAIAQSPASPLVCQPVTLTANATGPSLQYAWTIEDALGAPVHSGSGNPLVWSTTSVPAGVYTATVTATNTFGAASRERTVTLGALTPLVGGFAITHDPFSFGEVTFHAAVPGATEWRWNFGDGAGFGAWTNDPVTGPHPTHAYTTTGLKTVRVQVRNCQQAAVESLALPITIVSIDPLVAGFQAQGICFGIGCAADTGQAITFNDTSTGTPDTWFYAWNNTSATTCSGYDAGHPAAVTSHIYTAAGTFFPCVKVTRGTEEKTFRHQAISVAVPGGGGGDDPPPRRITVTGPSSGQTGVGHNFSASASNCTAAASGWTWSTSGGTIAGATNGSSIQVSWTTTGSKTVTARNSGCGSTLGSRSINISTPGGGGGGDLVPQFSVAPANPVVGQPVSFNASATTGTTEFYDWSFGDSTTGSGRTTNHTYGAAGNYTVTLTVAPVGCASPGCLKTLSKTVTVGPGGGDGGGGGGGGATAAFTFAPAEPAAGALVTFDASTSTGSPIDYTWSFGDGGNGAGQVVTHTFAAAGTYTVSLSITPAGCTSPGCLRSTSKVVEVVEQSAAPNGCTGVLADDDDKLCLGEGRYIVEVDWENHHQETHPTGAGQFRRLGGSESTGFFWFFNPDSIDLIVKIIDGSVLNDHVWVFYGALTDVIYDLKVTDTATGQTKSYRNLAGSICGRGDTTAFSTAALTAPARTAAAPAAGGDASRAAGEATTEELLLLGGRFRATVEWENQHVPAGTPRPRGVGKSVTGTDGSGYFYFFEPSSLDLVVKMIDARAFDGHFWVFYGGLSDVQYEIHIEDLETGETWEAINPAGSICGGSDTAAFSETGD